MPYPESLIYFGVPIGILGVGIECVIRRIVRHDGGELSYQKERRVKFLTRGVTLAIITAVYFLMEGKVP